MHPCVRRKVSRSLTWFGSSSRIFIAAEPDPPSAELRRFATLDRGALATVAKCSLRGGPLDPKEVRLQHHSAHHHHRDRRRSTRWLRVQTALAIASRRATSLLAGSSGA